MTAAPTRTRCTGSADVRRAVVAALLALVVLAGALASAAPAAVGDDRCPEPGTGRVVQCHHVVRRGEWLWSIARDSLRADFGMRRPLGRDIRTRAAELHALNRGAIGPDPARLRVGTRLRMYDWVDAPSGRWLPAPMPPPSLGPGLDPTYGGGDGVGSVERPARYADARSVALDPEGRAVTAGMLYGSFAVARFTPDGAPDRTFGEGGLVTTRIGSFGSAEAVAVQPDGRIVAAGSAGVAVGELRADVVLARHLPDGRLDPAFGEGGIVRTVFGGYAAGRAVVVQPDGRILVAGSASGDEEDLASDVALLRYLPDGSPDPSFGSAGRVVLDVAGGIDTAEDLVVLPDGRIRVAGIASPSPGSGEHDAFLAGFLADGRPDPGFGAGGRVVTDYGTPFDAASGLALRPDGSLVVAGSRVVERITAEVVLARHRPDGSLVGTTTSALGVHGTGIAVGRDGRTYVSAQAPGENAVVAMLLRYDAAGVLLGADRTPYGGTRSSAFGVVVDALGRPVVGGCTCDGGNTATRGGFEIPSAIVTARYLP